MAHVRAYAASGRSGGDVNDNCAKQSNANDSYVRGLSVKHRL